MGFCLRYFMFGFFLPVICDEEELYSYKEQKKKK